MLLLTKKSYKNSISPVLDGLYWLNYLGSKHLQEFDITKLENLEVYRKEWLHDNTSLFIQCTSSIEQFLEPNSLDMAKKSTKVLKKALKKGSLWR